jgi:hypothetical protein
VRADSQRREEDGVADLSWLQQRVAATTPGVLLKEPVISAAVRVPVELKAHQHEQAISALLVAERAPSVSEPAAKGVQLLFEASGGQGMKRTAELAEDEVLVGLDPVVEVRGGVVTGERDELVPPRQALKRWASQVA